MVYVLLIYNSVFYLHKLMPVFSHVFSPSVSSIVTATRHICKYITYMCDTHSKVNGSYTFT